jgi:hypothetical protein
MASRASAAHFNFNTDLLIGVSVSVHNSSSISLLHCYLASVHLVVLHTSCLHVEAVYQRVRNSSRSVRESEAKPVLRIASTTAVCSGAVYKHYSSAVYKHCSGAVYKHCSGAVYKHCSGAVYKHCSDSSTHRPKIVCTTLAVHACEYNTITVQLC